MSFDARKTNLRAINSMTKYPSISTYHALDPRNGNLLEQPVAFSGDVVVTEKIDGTNGRIIFLPDGSWLIGSREELLHARGDLIPNPTLGIVETLRPVAERLYSGPFGPPCVLTLYLEVYGGTIGSSHKQYTRNKSLFGASLFDVSTVPNFEEMLDWDPARIASWREHGGQSWLDEDDLSLYSDSSGIKLTPRVADLSSIDLPRTVEGMYGMLSDWKDSRATLDGTSGESEGVVLRTEDRGVIAKARFQDYERTLRRRENRGITSKARGPK